MKNRSDRGSVLVIVVVFAMSIMAFVASMLMWGIAMHTQIRTLGAAQEATSAAESGVHLVAAKLGGPERAALLEAGRADGVLRGSGAAAARFEVILRPGGDDRLDNDNDGSVDEEDEADIVEVVSTGYRDRVSRTVYVTLLARYRKPDVNAAVYVDDPAADLTLDGAAFLISGFDLNLARVPTGLTVPGIGVNGAPTLLRNSIQGKTAEKVIGEGGSPSILEVPPLDLQALIEEGARAANVVLTPNEVNQPPEDGAWGTLEKPAVVYSSDSVKVSGGSTGAGLLIVNGDLEISGGFEWTGLIVVRGGVSFKGGGGGKRVVGGLVVQKAVGSGGGTARAESSLRLSGTVDVLYSRESVGKVARLLSSCTILNWREGPLREERWP